MQMLFSQTPFSEKLVLPTGLANITTNDLFEKMGLSYQVSSGYWALSPIAHQITKKIENFEQKMKLRIRSSRVPLSREKNLAHRP